MQDHANPKHKPTPRPLRQQNADQFRLLVEQVQDYAIFLISPEGRVVTWNLGAERIKGYTADEIIGKPYETFFTEEDRAAGRPVRLMRRAREQGRVEDEGWRVRKDGSRFWADAVLTALVDANGTLRGFAKVTRDLTEQRKLAEQRYLIQALQATAESRDQALSEVRTERERLQALLSETQAARAETERAHQHLQRFMGLVAHDLRGPLTAIKAAAQLLSRPGMSPEHHAQAAAMVDRQVRRMVHMTDSLVEAARIGAGELTIQPVPTDLVALVRRLMEARQAATTAHHLRLDAPEHLEGDWDPDRLEQVLDNLLGNAIKYSPEGGEVRIQVERKDDEAHVRVRDQGIGISPDDLSQLFQLFSRLEPTRAIEGTGLGLYIVRGIVEAHGGRIWAQSAGRGQGSTFTLTLPLR